MMPERNHRTYEAEFAAFVRFVQFFCEVFSEKEPLAAADCRDSYKEYVPKYYRHIFGPGLEKLTPRHLKWFRRLSPLFALPKGATLLDYGGGYGMDSIFLASLGYEVLFYEITPHHIGIAKALAARFGERFGVLNMRFVHAKNDPQPTMIDAVMLDEVAHHIEPVERMFGTAADMLRPGGSLFLLEPNFLCPTVQLFFFRTRGFNVVDKRMDEETGEEYLWGNEHIRLVSDWTARARKFGFELRSTDYIVPWLMRGTSAQPSALRRSLEALPISRHLLGTHVTMRFAKA